MIELSNEFTDEEKKIINKWKDSKLLILKKLNKKCYLLNVNGDLTYEECFGKVNEEYFNCQRYYLAQPRRVIKYYNYYLLENKDKNGEWYVGEKQKNGNIEFSKCSETLEDAFSSL